jgi:hypothetical protein
MYFSISSFFLISFIPVLLIAYIRYFSSFLRLLIPSSSLPLPSVFLLSVLPKCFFLCFSPFVSYP